MHVQLPVALVRELTRNLKRLSKAGMCQFGTLSSGTDICMKVVEQLVEFWEDQYDIKVAKSSTSRPTILASTTTTVTCVTSARVAVCTKCRCRPVVV